MRLGLIKTWRFIIELSISRTKVSFLLMINAALEVYSYNFSHFEILVIQSYKNILIINLGMELVKMLQTTFVLQTDEKFHVSTVTDILT